MTNGEAIREIQKRIDTCEKWYLDKVPEYYDALTMAIAALEKQEQKERIMPNSDDILDGIEYHCPNCGRAYKQNSKYNFCIKCGQALLWKDDMRNIARATKEDAE